MNSADKYFRYQRQVILNEFGQMAQDKLMAANVLVIGAGGLGCPALQYLTAAGVGKIGIVDYDIVAISNLHRQILFSGDDVGLPKTKVASKKLNSLNPDITIETFQIMLDNKNALEIISGYDLVVDGSDNFATRYMVNDACVLLNKPLVYGAVMRFEGQVGVFNFADISTGVKTNYRDLFPNPPKPGTTLSCNEAGVLGVVTGIVGTMQAAEAIKIITSVGNVLCNSIVSYNVLNNTYNQFKLQPSAYSKSIIPTTHSEFEAFNYAWFCGEEFFESEISIELFDATIKKSNVHVIDVREKNENPVVTEFDHENVPFSIFEQHVFEIDSDIIVLFCQTGSRSRSAAAILKSKFPGRDVFSLSGGIIAWHSRHKKSVV